MATIGVLAIVFGCIGLMGSSKIIFMPFMLEMQKEIFTSLQEEIEADEETVPVFKPFEKMFRGLMDPIPPWFCKWSVGLGIIRLLIMGAYVFSGIWMLLAKPSAPKLFCWAIFGSISITILNTAGMIFAIGIFGAMYGFYGLFGVIIDLPLVSVVLAHKSEWKIKSLQELNVG